MQNEQQRSSQAEKATEPSYYNFTQRYASCRAVAKLKILLKGSLESWKL